MVDLSIGMWQFTRGYQIDPNSSVARQRWMMKYDMIEYGKVTNICSTIRRCVFQTTRLPVAAKCFSVVRFRWFINTFNCGSIPEVAINPAGHQLTYLVYNLMLHAIDLSQIHNISGILWIYSPHITFRSIERMIDPLYHYNSLQISI